MQQNKKENLYYEFKAGEKIYSRYWAHSQVGKGSFGTVIRSYDYVSNKDVAIKFLKSGDIFKNIGVSEVQKLNLINIHNKNRRYPIIMYLTTLTWKEHYCIVLPFHNYNLYYSVKKNKSIGFAFNATKHIATQLLECLFFLQHPEICLIHSDIKPDNVLRADTRSWKIVLIDFGSSFHDPHTVTNYNIQTIFYRAPEVILHLPFSYEIDMWSLGCLLFEIKTGQVLFEETNDMEILNSIIEVCGIPPPAMINNSDIYKDILNRKIKESNSNEKPRRKIFPPGKRNLDLILNGHINSNEVGSNDAILFLDLIKAMLVYDPKRRITPLEALRHPFIDSKETYKFDSEMLIDKNDRPLTLSSSCASSETALNIDYGPRNQIIENIDREAPSSKSIYKTHSCKSLSTSHNHKNIQKSIKFAIQEESDILESILE